jgi:hypothetical protein
MKLWHAGKSGNVKTYIREVSCSNLRRDDDYAYPDISHSFLQWHQENSGIFFQINIRPFTFKSFPINYWLNQTRRTGNTRNQPSCLCWTIRSVNPVWTSLPSGPPLSQHKPESYNSVQWRLSGKIWFSCVGIIRRHYKLIWEHRRVPQHTAKGEAAQQHRSLTSYRKGKTTQPGSLRTKISPQFFLIRIVGGGVQAGSIRHVGHWMVYCTSPGWLW